MVEEERYIGGEEEEEGKEEEEEGKSQGGGSGRAEGGRPFNNYVHQKYLLSKGLHNYCIHKLYHNRQLHSFVPSTLVLFSCEREPKQNCSKLMPRFHMSHQGPLRS